MILSEIIEFKLKKERRKKVCMMLRWSFAAVSSMEKNKRWWNLTAATREPEQNELEVKE